MNEPKTPSDQPKPASGEWTNVDVEELWEKGGSIAVKDAINAAIVASVDYWQGVATQEWHKGFAAGTEQLAAEREKRKQAEDDFITAGRNNEQLHTQLAAAVERGKQADVQLDHQDKVIKQLREKVQTLRNALKQTMNAPELYSPTWNYLDKVVKDALAKVSHD